MENDEKNFENIKDVNKNKRARIVGGINVKTRKGMHRINTSTMYKF